MADDGRDLIDGSKRPRHSLRSENSREDSGGTMPMDDWESGRLDTIPVELVRTVIDQVRDDASSLSHMTLLTFGDWHVWAMNALLRHVQERVSNHLYPWNGSSASNGREVKQWWPFYVSPGPLERFSRYTRELISPFEQCLPGVTLNSDSAFGTYETYRDRWRYYEYPQEFPLRANSRSWEKDTEWWRDQVEYLRQLPEFVADTVDSAEHDVLLLAHPDGYIWCKMPAFRTLGNFRNRATAPGEFASQIALNPTKTTHVWLSGDEYALPHIREHLNRMEYVSLRGGVDQEALNLSALRGVQHVALVDIATNLDLSALSEARSIELSALPNLLELPPLPNVHYARLSDLGLEHCTLSFPNARYLDVELLEPTVRFDEAMLENLCFLRALALDFPVDLSVLRNAHTVCLDSLDTWSEDFTDGLKSLSDVHTLRLGVPIGSMDLLTSLRGVFHLSVRGVPEDLHDDFHFSVYHFTLLDRTNHTMGYHIDARIFDGVHTLELDEGVWVQHLASLKKTHTIMCDVENREMFRGDAIFELARVILTYRHSATNPPFVLEDSRYEHDPLFVAARAINTRLPPESLLKIVYYNEEPIRIEFANPLARELRDGILLPA